MKKIYLLILFLFCIFKLNAQSVSLNTVESLKYLNDINSIFGKIKTLPEGKTQGSHWSFGKYTVGTNGKVINDKLYSVNVDNNAYWDDGSHISILTFYVRANDPKTKYFPLEIISFTYDHKTNKGLLSWDFKNSLDGNFIHRRSKEKIVYKIDDLINQIDNLL